MKLIDGVELIKNLERKIFSAEVYNDEFDGTFIGNLLCLGDVTEEVIELQQAIGWIPCSEKLPKDREEVLITDSDKKVRLIIFNKWLYENPQYSHNIIPIAWQPLPPKYEG